jgi:hypothetical protein
MNKAILVGFLLCLSFFSFASTYKVELVELMEPVSEDADYSVFAQDGRIYNIDANDRELIDLAKMAIKSKAAVKLRLSNHFNMEELTDTRNEIINIKILSKNEPILNSIFQKNITPIQDILMSTYVTDMNDEIKLGNYFNSMRRKFKRRSQCYNRAHVWAWEMSFNKMNGKRVQMGKTWIFFTRKYIREYKYKWWFHIAPYLTLNKEIRVLDKKFTDNPEPLQNWIDEFIYSKEECKIISKYSDYRNHQTERDCFIINSSLHYWQPRDLEKAESEGVMQDRWTNSRLKAAYKNAVRRTKPPVRN